MEPEDAVEPGSVPPRLRRGLLGAVLKQYDTGMWLGMVKSLISRTMFYIGTIKFILITLVAWEVTVEKYVIDIIPWYNYPLFLLTLVIIVAIAFVVEFKFILPSSVVFGNWQGWTHRSWVRQSLERVEEQLGNIQGRVDKVEEKRG